ncbi:MAG: hypothetical protein OXG64_08235 [Chloroflexi bacterium]|nr:hypothetical protein [Chloroflexota bacterium]
MLWKSTIYAASRSHAPVPAGVADLHYPGYLDQLFAAVIVCGGICLDEEPVELRTHKHLFADLSLLDRSEHV